jgi:hypothetical protein
MCPARHDIEHDDRLFRIHTAECIYPDSLIEVVSCIQGFDHMLPRKIKPGDVKVYPT